MKILLYTLIILLVSCSNYYEPNEDQTNFDSQFDQDFTWKSTETVALQFNIPDYEIRKTILVEMRIVSELGERVKHSTQYLQPGQEYQQNFLLSNHIALIEIVLQQGTRTRLKTIKIEDLADVHNIYLDETLAKGDLQ